MAQLTIKCSFIIQHTGEKVKHKFTRIAKIFQEAEKTQGASQREGPLAGKKEEKRSDAHMDIAPFSSVSAGGNLRLRLSVARREQPSRRSPRRARGRFPRSGWPSDRGWRRSPFIFMRTYIGNQL